MKLKFKTIVSLSLCVALMILSLSGISAYFTDTETVTNVFTIGNVSIELEEPNWKEPVGISPNETVPKDPQVHNNGTSDAYIYVEVVVPYVDVTTADLDGQLNEKDHTELFTYDVNDGWVEVDTIVDEENGVVKHIYAYVGDDDSTLEPLAPGDTTPTVFDEITFTNVVENQGLEGEIQKVVINSYAIQTDIPDLDGDPEDIWNVVDNSVDNDTPEQDRSITVEAHDKDGNDLNASAEEITGDLKDELLDSLDESGLANKEDVDLVIDIESDDFDDIAETTIDVSNVAEKGDTVIIVHYDEETDEWEYITTDEVDEDLTVSGDFSSFSPVVIIVVPKVESEAVPFAIFTYGDKTNDTTADDYNTLVFFRRSPDGVPGLDPDVPLEAGVSTYSASIDAMHEDVDGTNDGTFNRTIDVIYPGISGTYPGISSEAIQGFEDTYYYSGLTESVLPPWGVLSGDSSTDGGSLDDILGGLGGSTGSTDLDDLLGGGGLAGIISEVEKVVFYDEIKPVSTSNWFAEAMTCKTMDLRKLNTSNVTNMESMFLDCQWITSFDIDHFDTSKVTTMNRMFRACGSLESLDLSNFNTANVTDMSNMFDNCPVMTSVNVSSFDTSNVTNMTYMFNLCSALTSLDVTNFDTSKVTNMSWMFADCCVLPSLDLSSFDTTNVTDMSAMFRMDTTLDEYPSDIARIYVSDLWDTSNVTASSEMFVGCTNLVSETTGHAFEGPSDVKYANYTESYGYLTYKAAPTN